MLIINNIIFLYIPFELYIIITVMGSINIEVIVYIGLLMRLHQISCDNGVRIQFITPSLARGIIGLWCDYNKLAK